MCVPSSCVKRANPLLPMVSSLVKDWLVAPMSGKLSEAAVPMLSVALLIFLSRPT